MPTRPSPTAWSTRSPCARPTADAARKPAVVLRRHTGVNRAGAPPQERTYVGEPLDFDAFYRNEYRRVFALAFAVLRSPAAAEDATQDAFLAVYKRWKAGPDVR